MEIRNLEKVQNLCNCFNVWDVVEAIEEALPEQERGWGTWQESFLIFPNITKCMELLPSEDIIVSGKYWAVFPLDNQKYEEALNKIEEMGYMWLDDITISDFED